METRQVPDEKTCRRCALVKPAADFIPNARMRSGLSSYCRSCNAEKGREWKAANPDRAAAHAASRRPRTTLERRKVGLWVKFRMRWDDYEALLAKQGGACAICRTEDPATKSGTFTVDHCHATGAVRGLLCMNCNLALGHFKDSRPALRRALKYLSGT